MASDVEGADVWSDLCKLLEACEPLDIHEIWRLWSAASKLPAINSPVDVSQDVRNFLQRRVALDSEELREWWFKVQSSSSLITRTPLNSEEWYYLMDILDCVDASCIEHLLLELDPNSATTLPYACLGTTLSRRSFCELKTLIVRLEKDSGGGLYPQSLADAVRGPGLKNLRTLKLPYRIGDEVDTDTLADLYIIPRLTSLRVNFEYTTVPGFVRVFKSGRFKNLQCLDVSDNCFSAVASEFWEVFIETIKSRNLPRLAHLRLYLGGADLENADPLADLFRDSGEWFSSLRTLHIEGGWITSEHVCSLVNAVMEDPLTQLALTRLNISLRNFSKPVVMALARLADSHRLPQLQGLDLRATYRARRREDVSKSLVTLVQSIGKGGWPSLQKLWWSFHILTEKDANSVVSIYHNDHTLTTEVIGIPWDEYTDL